MTTAADVGGAFIGDFMKKFLWFMFGIALMFAEHNKAQASKLCMDAKVHEYVINVDKMFEGNARAYFSVMAAAGHVMDKKGARKLLRGKAIECVEKSFCVGTILIIRVNAAAPTLDLKAFCRKERLRRAKK